MLFPKATAANTRLTTLAHPARWACGPDRDADGIADGLTSQVEMMTEGVALIPSVSWYT